MLSKTGAIVRPVLTTVIVVLALKMTGLLSYVSDITQTVVLKTGVLDARAPESNGDEEVFDFNFAIKDMAGKRLSIDQLKGKVIFLNLWATWCGPCRAEMPTIQKLYEAIGKDNVVFVILSIDRDQDKDKIINYVAAKAYTFPVYQPSGRLTNQLDVPSIPTTFIISKEGKVIAKEVGTTNFNTSKFKNFLQTEANR
jgi:thiol-disulfide isomerase/thioredoxin